MQEGGTEHQIERHTRSEWRTRAYYQRGGDFAFSPIAYVHPLDFLRLCRECYNENTVAFRQFEERLARAERQRDNRSAALLAIVLVVVILVLAQLGIIKS